jgi:hypothetical protein
MRRQVEDHLGPSFSEKRITKPSPNALRKKATIHHRFFAWGERQWSRSRFTPRATSLRDPWAGREEKGMSIPDDFQQTLRRERTANKHFLAGDAAPVKAMWSHADDVPICGGL